MPVINLHRAVQEIRLSDEEDSPVFQLDLSDSAINEKTPLIAGCWAVYKNATDAYQEGKLTGAEYRARQASVYKQVIIALLGEEAFNAVYEYVRGVSDLPPEELTLAMTPLAEYLLMEYDAILTANRSKVIKEFVEGADGTDAL